MFRYLPCDLDRIRFRHLRRGDLEDFLAYRKDPEVARYQGWDPMTEREGETFLESHSRHACLTPGVWQQLGIADLKSDALIGDIGLCLASDRSSIEFGISLRAQQQGRGLGTECIRGLIPLLFLASPATKVVAHTDVRNPACIAALKNSGMKQNAIRHGVYKGEHCSEVGFLAERN